MLEPLRHRSTCAPGRSNQRFAPLLLSVGLLALVPLALIGCNSKEPDTGADTHEPDHEGHSHDSSHAHSHDSESTSEVEGSILSLERRTEIWNREHLAFELEYRWAKAWLAALINGNEAPLRSSFQSECQLLAVNSTGDAYEHPNFIETGSSNDPATDDTVTSLTVDEFVTRWRARVSGSATSTTSRCEIIELQPASENERQFQATIHWTIASDSSTNSWEGTDLLNIEIDQPENVDSVPIVKSWQEVSWRSLTSKRTWFEESTELHRLHRQGIYDNRDPNLEDKNKIFMRFMTGVEDFNGDGRIDMVIASANDPPRLIRQQPNRIFLQRARELGIDVPRPFPSILALWIDFDNDRDPDLLIGDRVYRNDDSIFVEVTTTCGLQLHPYCMGGTVADYDLDGDLDLYLIYHQELLPNKQFVSWLDGENCGRYNQLWQNQGDGTFKDVTAESRAGGGGRYSNAGTFVHLNNDLYPDLVVTNQFARNVYLLNQQDGTFKDMTRDWGAESVSISAGIATGDINRDGFTDLFLGGRSSSVVDRMLNSLTESDHTPLIREQLGSITQGNQLWLSSEQGLSRGNPSIAALRTGWTYGTALADLDNDGYLDLLAATGHQSYDVNLPDGSSPFWQSFVIAPENYFTRLTPKGTLDEQLAEPWEDRPTGLIGTPKNLASFEPNRVLLGSDALSFRDVSFVSGLALDSDSRSIIPCDLDRDGAIDIVVGSVGGGPLRSFRNRGADGHWFGMQLVGSDSNAYGIGARIKLTVGGQTIAGDLFPATSFLSTGPAEIHFGLGSTAVIDRVEIRWPSGKVTVAEQVAADRWTRWSEATDEVTTLEPPMFEDSGGDTGEEE